MPDETVEATSASEEIKATNCVTGVNGTITNGVNGAGVYGYPAGPGLIRAPPLPSGRAPLKYVEVSHQ